MPKIKVNLYKQTSLVGNLPLDTLINLIAADDLEHRVRTIGYNDIRLEQFLRPNTPENRTPYWLLDFVKMRMDQGPGKVGTNTPIQGFALANNEGFGEETAALFDPARKYLLVQYNHYGVRGPAIEKYFNTYDATWAEQYGLDLKLDTRSEAKLATKQFITKVKVKIAPAQMTAAHRTNNVSLQQALALNDTQRGNSVEFTIAASRGQSLANNPIHRMMNALRTLRDADANEGTEVLEQFQVEAKAHLQDRAERIDMLLPALEENPGGVVLGPDRRFTVESRWDALLRTRAGWNGIIR